MRILFLYFFLLLISSCTNVLRWRSNSAWEKINFIESGERIILKQGIQLKGYDDDSLNRGMYIDITILDSVLAMQSDKLMLNDSKILEYKANTWGTDNWKNDSIVVEGWIKIVKWNSDYIKIKENILIINLTMVENTKFKGSTKLKYKK